jgi:hypothetical protein
MEGEGHNVEWSNDDRNNVPLNYFLKGVGVKGPVKVGSRGLVS